MNTQILTVSSKGQVSLPVGMRKNLSIHSGDKLLAYAADDFIMLKILDVPTEEDCKAAMKEAREWASSVGLTEEDIRNTVKEVRQKGKL